MRKIVLALALALFGFGMFQANAQVDGAYKNEIKKYLANSGSMGTFDQVIDQMMMMMGGSLNDSQKEEVKTRAYDSLIDLFVPIYEKEIQLDDLKEFNKFYETPAGKRIAAAQGKMVQSSMAVGQQWAAELQKIIQEVMAK